MVPRWYAFAGSVYRAFFFLIERNYKVRNARRREDERFGEEENDAYGTVAYRRDAEGPQLV